MNLSLQYSEIIFSLTNFPELNTKCHMRQNSRSEFGEEICFCHTLGYIYYFKLTLLALPIGGVRIKSIYILIKL